MQRILAFALIIICCHANGQEYQSVSIKRQGNHPQQFIQRSSMPFYHGVASGDPLNDRVIIWTRVTPPDSLFLPVDVNWEVSTDLQFSNVVQSGTFTTDSSRDYTVKIDVGNLQPNTYYYYRFENSGAYSLIGRTKTTPVSLVNNIKLGVVSCSDYRQGYFTAYRKMAERNDLDAVLHLGDYIYETGGGPAGREHDPNAEIFRLFDYRTRLSQYHLDEDLMRCHQLYPFVVIWDDHDIVVDALRDTSFRHDSQFGNYSDRKFAAVKAAREWLPMRDDSSFYKNWRKLPFGGLLDVFMIDARLYDRDRFATDAADTLYGSPFAKMLGPDQLNWLNSELAASSAQWKIIGNQLMMGHFRAITNDPLVFENWDGYPVEREQFLDNIINNNIDNVVVVTGDFHCSFALDIAKEPRDLFEYNPFNGNGSKCVEFIVPSITGDNFDEGNNFGLPSASFASTLINTGNQHIKYNELEGHGYVLLDLNPSRAQAEFWHMADKNDPQNNVEALDAIWFAAHQGNKVQQGSAASARKTNVPQAPPFKTIMHISEDDEPVVLSIGPNPVTSYLLVNYAMNSSVEINISVFASAGQRVFNRSSHREAGNYVDYLDCTGFPSGTYILLLESGSQRFTRKFVKQ